MSPEEQYLEKFMAGCSNIEHHVVGLAMSVMKQRCMNALCEGCRKGWQLGGHHTEDIRKVCHFNPATQKMHLCDAWPIREMETGS